MNKRGVFYTILSILFVSLMIFSFSYRAEGNRLRDQIYIVETRVYALNEFFHDAEKDLERGLYISGFRSLSSIVDHIIQNGVFIDDVNASFEEAFFNGTINGTPAILMVDNSFDDWLSRFQNIAENIGIDADIELQDIEIYHSSPWHVNVKVNASISLLDSKGIANFTQNKSIEAVIDIRGFEDPLYVANSYGRVTNKINQTTYEGNYTSGSGPTFDPSNLEAHAKSSFYTSNTNAPSFLMRLENDLGPSQYGIESFVYPQKLIDKALDVDDKSLIDYIYFSDSNPVSYHVNDMPDWFVIDDSRTGKYEVTGEIY